MFVEVVDGDPTICTVLVSINLRLFQMGKRKKSLKKVVKKTVAKLAEFSIVQSVVIPNVVSVLCSLFSSLSNI